MNRSTLDAISRANWERRTRQIVALQAPSLVAMRLLTPVRKRRKSRVHPDQMPLPFGSESKR